MSDSKPQDGAGRDPWARHVLVLTALCVVVFAIGPTTQGVASWHEGQRLLVARQMLDAGEWVVPRVHGRAYLAKPPLVYWCQMALASLRGDRVWLVDTRLTMAIWAWLGVLGTYVGGRELLRGAGGARAAFWGAAFLGTGLEYARLARLGQIDMLLAAPMAVGAWAMARGLRRRADGRPAWGSVLLGGGAAAVAGLAKGPPALAMFVVVGLGSGVVLALADQRGSGGLWARVLGWSGSAVGAAVGGLISVSHAREAGWTLVAAVGVLMQAALGGGLGCVVGSVMTPRRLGVVARTVWRTGVVAMLALGVVPVLWWGAAVRARLGDQTVAAWAANEAGENLVLFWATTPVQNLGTLVYGAGLGSLAAVGGLAMWIRGRVGARRAERSGRAAAVDPEGGLDPSFGVLLAWAIGGVLMFSVVGRGSSRYLLPVLPAIALIGGLVVARAGWWGRAGVRRAVAIGVGVLAVALSAWFGAARSLLEGDRSPRDFMRALLAPGTGVSPDRLGVYDMLEPSLDYYADHPVRPIGGAPSHLTGQEPMPLWRLRRELRQRGGSFTILARVEREGGSSPAGRFEEVGLRVERLEIGAAWTYAGTPVGAFMVTADTDGQEPDGQAGARGGPADSESDA
ncbi:MAG: glycosyltransferase family 39 protein [Phycisphaeraceae bacterium]|nr:glycosyltransferase family 39 protein [Phycisphaeraceae bacterium]